VDPRIERVLERFHCDLATPVNVDRLAEIAGLSRSVFTDRFTSAVGMSPARYLAHWRMHVAGAWLRHGGQTVSDIAQRLGYESEASFSRAFKRLFGVAPGALRRQTA